MNKNIHFDRSMWILVGTSIFLWIFLVWLFGIDKTNFIEMLKQIPNVITLITFGIVIFSKWLWKIPLFQRWLVCIPNLNGTWIGEIQSSWIDPNSNTAAPHIKVMLTIRQTLFSISCVMQTKEMKSYSSIEGFEIDEDRQVSRLSYIYVSKPVQLVQNRSSTHNGAIVFDIFADTQKLIGEYWTSRKTNGKIELKFYSKKLLKEFQDS